MSIRNDNDSTDPLAALGRTSSDRDRPLVAPRPIELAPDVTRQSLGVVEGVRTYLANQKVRGQMARAHGEAAIRHQTDTLVFAERMKADVQKQRLLNAGQEIGGQLETASLEIAGATDREQIRTTTAVVAECNKVRNDDRRFIAQAVESGDFDDQQAAELDAIGEMLTNRAKSSALDRHERLAERRRDQFGHGTRRYGEEDDR